MSIVTNSDSNSNCDCDSEGSDAEREYSPDLERNQRGDDLGRFCSLCSSELVFEADELLCSGCAYAPTDDPQPRSQEDKYQTLWNERNRLSARTGPHRKRVVGSFEEAYDYE